MISKLALATALAFATTAALADPTPGVTHLGTAATESRPLALSIWYPATEAASASVGGNAVFAGTPAAPDAPIPAGPLPLVLVSHGGLRSAAESGAWLSAALAEAGYVAAEVDAPRPAAADEAVNEIWQRSQDLGRALDLILADPDWAERIDTSRIYAVGFALGGTAAMSAAGYVIDPRAYVASCSTRIAPAPDCGWYASEHVSPNHVDHAELAQSRYDPRIAAAVALAPEYLAVFAPSDVIKAPTLVISLDGSSPVFAEGPAGETTVLADATAFDAFAACTKAGPAILKEDGGDPALCGDEAAARDHAHRRIVEAITAFLARPRG